MGQADTRLMRGRKKDDEGNPLCACGLQKKHGGPCGLPDHSQNKDSLPVRKVEKKEEEKAAS